MLFGEAVVGLSGAAAVGTAGVGSRTGAGVSIARYYLEYRLGKENLALLRGPLLSSLMIWHFPELVGVILCLLLCTNY